MRPFVTRSFSTPLLIAAALNCLLVSPVTSRAQAPIDTPQTNLAPIAPPSYTPPSSGYGQFDPYAPAPSGGLGGFGTGGAAFGGGTAFSNGGGLGPGVTAIGPPTPIGPPTNGGFFDRMFSQPDAPAPPSLAPNFGAPASGQVWNGQTYGPSSAPYNNSNVYGPPITAQPPGASFPSTAYPSSTPSTLFPSGVFNGAEYNSIAQPVYSAFRLLQGPRFRYTYIGSGGSANDLGINDIDTSLVFAFPNFFYMQQPLYVVPSFSLHLWDGPNSSTGADLPSKAYSAFIDTGWQSDPNQMFGTELGVRVGAFTAFDTFTSKSVRVKGKALVNFRLSPTSTLKGGVFYLDRSRFKLLPAFGILCQPNPYTRYDIFFPEPKFARYFRTLGTMDVWWYVAGQYGGGTWTVTRDLTNLEERVDINDIRVTTGFEWGDSPSIRAGRRTAFTEIGYVFDRELQYYQTPADNIDLGSAFLFRAGFRY